MSLGFDAISALPFAASGNEGNVTINVTKNTLTITIGSVGIIADSIVEDPDPNRLTLGTGTLTISGKANVTVTMTGAEFKTLETNAVAHIDTLYADSWTRKDAVNACTTMAEVDAI